MTYSMSTAAARKASKKTQHVRSAGDWITLILLVAGALLVLFPLLVLTVNAFKTSADYNATGPLSLPKHFTMEGIISFWTTTNFPLKFWNSFIISLVVAVAAVVLSVLNSFALGIGKVKGNTWIVLGIMLANMMPQEALLYPLYTMFKQVGLYNTKLAIIIIFTIIQSAYGTYLLSSVYGTFPQAILEAAAIDGASRWQILRKVVLPISWPTISVLFVFFFVWTWNEYMIPMAFLMGDDVQTIPLALATLQGQRTMEAQRQKIAEQQTRIVELEPKARFADAVAASDGTCLVGELAKMLRQNGMDIGQNRLFRLLQADGYLGKSGSNRNVPTQRAMDLGLFRIKETTVTHADGHTTVSRTPKVTGKGQRYFIDRYWGRAQPTLEAGA